MKKDRIRFEREKRILTIKQDWNILQIANNDFLKMDAVQKRLVYVCFNSNQDPTKQTKQNRQDIPENTDLKKIENSNANSNRDLTYTALFLNSKKIQK